MEPAVLSTPQLGSDYIPPETQECIEPISSHGQQSYGSGRESLGHTPSLYPLSHGGTVRCMPSRSAHENAYHGAPSNYSDSASGSIAASPSSNASSLAFPSFPGTSLYPGSGSTTSLAGQYTASPGTAGTLFGNSYVYSSQSAPMSGMSHARPRISLTDPSTIGIVPAARPQPLGSNPVSPTSGSVVRDNYSTSTPGLNRHLGARPHLDISRPYHHSVPETPRTMLSPHSFSPTSNMYSHGYSSQATPRGTETPPFQDQEDFHEIRTGEHALVHPTIHSKIEKGFFYSNDGCWTCYRRNYFSVQCSYQMDPFPSGRPIFLVKNGKSSQIQAMAMSLSAVVDGSTGKGIDLVQHTPKRDKGPQSAIRITRLAPTNPGPRSSHGSHESHGYHAPNFGMGNSQSGGCAPITLPFQSLPEYDSQATAGASNDSSTAIVNTTPPHGTSHTFERIQFKSATANNGKRRAQQQYYHLIVELHVDIRTSQNQSPQWVKVAQKASSQVVVRGRSPSHYSNEGPNTYGRGGGGTPGGMGGAHQPRIGTGWSASLGSSMGHSYSTPPMNSYSMGHAHNRSSYPLTEHHLPSLHLHDTGPAPMRSLPSAAPPASLLHDEESKPQGGYSYHPSPLYDAGVAPGLGIKQDSIRNDEGSHMSHHMSHSLPMMNGNCRPSDNIGGVDSSKGHYQYMGSQGSNVI